MLLDQPYPMDMWLEARFQGPLSRPAVQEAVATLRERHPLLTATVEVHNGQRCWMAGSGEIPLVHVDANEVWPQLDLDPTRGVGARVYMSPDAIYMHVHHACADGTALRLLFMDLAIAYAHASAPGGSWRGHTRWPGP